MKNNVLDSKSKSFAIRVVRLYQFLVAEKQEYVLSKQLLRSGTSIGANVRESIYAQSRPDFHSKLSIALKETGETEFWLELLRETNYITKSQFESIYIDCKELIKILVTITKKTKTPRKTNNL